MARANARLQADVNDATAPVTVIDDACRINTHTHVLSNVLCASTHASTVLITCEVSSTPLTLYGSYLCSITFE